MLLGLHVVAKIEVVICRHLKILLRYLLSIWRRSKFSCYESNIATCYYVNFIVRKFVPVAKEVTNTAIFLDIYILQFSVL